jgi:hypothetical protein
VRRLIRLERARPRPRSHDDSCRSHPCLFAFPPRLNRLVRETGAVACIHTGDFGLYERQSIERISDK